MILWTNKARLWLFDKFQFGVQDEKMKLSKRTPPLHLHCHIERAQFHSGDALLSLAQKTLESALGTMLMTYKAS